MEESIFDNLITTEKQSIMKKLLLSLFVCMFCTTLSTLANDGSYYASGNFLFPLQETSISVRSEVLTISICDDGCAKIDVLYTFFNDGPSKTIDMAFESPLPYNSGDDFSHIGKHPCIFDFTATLNDQAMLCRSAVVVDAGSNIEDYKTFDRNWHQESEDFNYGEHIITNGKDTVEVTAYGYLFKATFKPGLNTVHHTYRYQASGGLSANFEIPYILEPCTRWANHQVDDFTLRIATPSTAKHFYLHDDVLRRTEIKVISGTGKVRTGTIPSGIDDPDIHYQEVSLRNGVVECHIKNFKPQANLHILSADHMICGDDNNIYYNRGWIYFPQVSADFKLFYGREPANDAEEEALSKRVMRNLPYADRGYVFSDSRLRRLFESQWWYMPDPNWQMSTDGFTETDWRFIKELGK